MDERFSKQNLAPAADCACFNIRKASRVITQHFDEVMQPSGLRGTQFSILAIVARRGAPTMSELAANLVMDRTTLTRNLRPLEEQGLIKNVPGVDRRTRSISLTSKGCKVLAKALPFWRKAQSSVIRYLGGARFARVLGDLRFIEKMPTR
jgi:DNA-binding MarR family transcriptional regulator